MYVGATEVDISCLACEEKLILRKRPLKIFMAKANQEAWEHTTWYIRTNSLVGNRVQPIRYHFYVVQQIECFPTIPRNTYDRDRLSFETVRKANFWWIFCKIQRRKLTNYNKTNIIVNDLFLLFFFFCVKHYMLMVQNSPKYQNWPMIDDFACRVSPYDARQCCSSLIS